jgi:sulfur carrier protein ThiS
MAEKDMMKVSIEANGEFITAELPRNSTIRALFDGGHLRGIDVTAVRVNGRPATVDTPVEEGDRVQTAPVGGRLA